MNNAFFEEEVEKALAVLRKGGVILYPTDTIWGLGCDATNEIAVRKIYSIKEREDSKSMIVLMSDEREVLQYVAAPDPLVFDFLEGEERPTTVIFENAMELAPNVIAGDGSVGIRIVRDTFCRHLIKRLRKPIVSTSANISGTPSPAHFGEVSEALMQRVDHVVAWRKEDRTPSQPSQIMRWENGSVSWLRR